MKQRYYTDNYKEKTNPYPSPASESEKGLRNNENQFIINDEGEAEYPENNLKEEIPHDLYGYEDALFSVIDNWSFTPKWDTNKKKEEKKRTNDIFWTLSFGKPPKDAQIVKEDNENAVWSSDRDYWEEKEEILQEFLWEDLDEENENLSYRNKIDKNWKGPYHYTTRSKVKIKKNSKGRNVWIVHTRFFQKKKVVSKNGDNDHTKIIRNDWENPKKFEDPKDENIVNDHVKTVRNERETRENLKNLNDWNWMQDNTKITRNGKRNPYPKDWRHDNKVKVYNGNKNQWLRNDRQYTKRELKELKKRSV